MQRQNTMRKKLKKNNTPGAPNPPLKKTETEVRRETPLDYDMPTDGMRIREPVKKAGSKENK